MLAKVHTNFVRQEFLYSLDKSKGNPEPSGDRGIGGLEGHCVLSTAYERDASHLAVFSFFDLKQVLVSSPEHEVLMVSYCDQSMSVVCRPSSTICFKS